MPRCMILCELKANFYCFLQNLFSYNFISSYIISGTNWKIKEKTNLFFSLANVYDKAHWRNAPKTRLHSYKSFFFFLNASKTSHRDAETVHEWIFTKAPDRWRFAKPRAKYAIYFLAEKNFNLWNYFFRTLVDSSLHWCLLSLFAFNKPRSQCILWTSCLNLKLYNHSSFELFYS